MRPPPYLTSLEVGKKKSHSVSVLSFSSCSFQSVHNPLCIFSFPVHFPLFSTSLQYPQDSSRECDKSLFGLFSCWKIGSTPRALVIANILNSPAVNVFTQSPPLFESFPYTWTSLNGLTGSKGLCEQFYSSWHIVFRLRPERIWPMAQGQLEGRNAEKQPIFHSPKQGPRECRSASLLPSCSLRLASV